MTWCAMCGNRNDNRALGDENYSAISSKIRRLDTENNELRGLLSRLQHVRFLRSAYPYNSMHSWAELIDAALSKSTTPNAKVSGGGTFPPSA